MRARLLLRAPYNFSVERLLSGREGEVGSASMTPLMGFYNFSVEKLLFRERAGHAGTRTEVPPRGLRRFYNFPIERLLLRRKGGCARDTAATFPSFL